MKKLMVCACMSFGIMCGATAKGNTGNTKKPSEKKETTTSAEKESAEASSKKVAALVEKRATVMTDQMIRELRLNNYQANKLRAINLDKVAKMQAVEAQFAGNQQLIDEKCKAICGERDQELERVLSTVQYNHYFGDRKIYNKRDREFVAGLNAPQKDAAQATDQMATSTGTTTAVTIN